MVITSPASSFWKLLLRTYVLSSFLAASCVSTLFSQTPCVDGTAGLYPCQNMDLLSYMPLALIGGGANTNDIWGWTSPNTNREYALVGCSNGTAFVDISDPINPVYVGLLPTHTTNNLWRDLESRGNYLFIGSEAPDHGVQIFNLLQLDDAVNFPVTFANSAHYAGFGHSHTITVDQEAGWLYGMGSNTFEGGLHIVDINNPLNPLVLGGFANDGYTHDGFACTYHGPDPDHQDRRIMVACNADALTIVNCSDPTDCQYISTATYPEVGYVHQGWFTRDFRYFLLNDELDETQLGANTRTHLWDLLDLDNPVYMGYKQWDTPNIDHNLYIQDQFVYASNYRAGVRIMDAINVADASLTEVGYFDLFPLNDLPNFSGTWSNFPFLPSGVNIATSMYDGLFVTQQTVARLSENRWSLCDQDQLSFELSIGGALQFPLTPSLEGLPVGATLSGSVIPGTGVHSFSISGLGALPAGDYTAQLVLTTEIGRDYRFPLFIGIAGSSASTSLIAPPAGDVFFEFEFESIQFSWTPTPGSSGYVFQLSNTEDFSTTLIDQNLVNNAYILYEWPGESDLYWRVKPIDACGEGEFTSVRSVFLSSTIEETAVASFKAWPNPATDNFTLQRTSGDAVLHVTDLTGRTVAKLNLRGQAATLVDCSLWAPGMYLITDGLSTQKIFVNR
jgi:choice-of-anchor B domain-containing protein